MTTSAPLNSPELWLKEFGAKGIPSSQRDDPSGSVVTFASYVAGVGERPGPLLDIGAGSGRNSLYMAEKGFPVVAMDFVPDLVTRIANAGQPRVRGVCHDVGTPWPFKDGQFRFAIDTFCFKHQVVPTVKRIFHSELRRVLRASGLILLTCAGVDDGYYGRLLAQSPDPARNVIIDSHNGIGSVLYTEVSIRNEFMDAFDVMVYQHKTMRNMMHGEWYDRSTHLFILRKRETMTQEPLSNSSA